MNELEIEIYLSQEGQWFLMDSQSQSSHSSVITSYLALRKILIDDN